MDCEKKFTRLHSQPIHVNLLQMVVKVKHERKHENENVVQILSPMVKWAQQTSIIFPLYHYFALDLKKNTLWYSSISRKGNINKIQAGFFSSVKK